MPIALLLLLTVILSASDGSFPMRDRVVADAVTGIAFRCPYAWTMPDQYRAEFLAPGARMTVTIEGMPRQVERRAVGTDGKPIPVVKVVGSTLDQVPTGVSATATLAEMAAAFAGSGLEWREISYYRDPEQRQQAQAQWAPLGVEMSLGTGKDRSALAIRHDGRIDVIIAAVSAADPIIQALYESVEVMATGLKPVAKPKPGRRMTWRERQCKKGLVLGSSGVPKKPIKAKIGVDWTETWEVETEHYHLTGNRDPVLLQERAALCEALFRAYVTIYEPAGMPPVKFEVHCIDLARQYEGAVRQWFEPQFNVREGHSVNGGFFVPSLLALWLYEESGDLAGPSMDIAHVAAHEASHQFLHMACNGSRHVPTWFNEGLAVYFENGVFRGKEFELRPPTERIDALRTQYKKEHATIWPMEQYLDHHGPINAAQYGEVYAMVHFWVFGTCSPNAQACKHKSCGLKRFRDYWQALKKGEDGTVAFERIFLTDLIAAQGGRGPALGAWAKALREYVEKGLKNQ